MSETTIYRTTHADGTVSHRVTYSREDAQEILKRERPLIESRIAEQVRLDQKLVRSVFDAWSLDWLT